MSNGNSSGASDIITYIGVPLAVLGILPILWNSVLTLWTSFQIRRVLERNHILRQSAAVRADIVNRVIEVDFERVALSPPSLERAAPGYWVPGSGGDDATGTTLRGYSNLPGGTWTLLSPPWEPEPVGRVSQRVQYVDELRQPQAEVELRALVRYLLDLGAVPAARGWCALKERELWTKKGEVLLLADGGYSALEVAPRGDAEGMLSLRVIWLRGWTVRGPESLPLDVVRLAVAHGGDGQKKGATSRGISAEMHSYETDPSSAPAADAEDHTDIICRISVSGITSASRHYVEHKAPDTKKLLLDTQHLCSRRGNLHGAYFASAAIAYAMTTAQAVLWDYVIPSDILNLATAETVPCGVLILLGLANEADAPQWMPRVTSPVLDGEVPIPNDFFTKHQTTMTKQDRDLVVATERTALRDQRRRMAEREEEVRRDTAARSAYVTAALASSRWDAPRAAVPSMRWLQLGGHVDTSIKTPNEAVGALLHQMVREPAFSASVFAMLDAWKAWVNAAGGMDRQHLDALHTHKLEFAVASVLLGVVGEAIGGEVSVLAADMRDCMARWRTVRLG